ncbi:uncharacterized protein Z518_05004 [Rhinocladiella mackenziei CBS 650.93]|uniref:Rhinocladiella mackenziei CBS 650.93 unplaced genomic scaffold supercont1.3, whole genome shotgun sequence n=1 Tax=Rhinocladiella mackenziei CBS 650.93 TaxID=1442369 RepID=A0A0D2H984_9EURO|nr:uncharacterized protein Z518_05004 [Rhinocladiella mackenziei CBS 650.93]KIX07028.1 hypothetical protein Z518_05004 [Rhinocladiella mackenziei CBS 650.93]
MNVEIESLSSVVGLFLTQQISKPLLHEKSTSGGADSRYTNEMIPFPMDSGSIIALVRGTETAQKAVIRAHHMVACHGLLKHSFTIYFNMDVGEYVKGKYDGVIYVDNPIIRGFF